MATLLQAMNASLKRCGAIQGDTGNLVTSTVTSTSTGLTATGPFTVSSIQRQIDVMLQVWNEAGHEIFSRQLLPASAATGSVTLATDANEYALATDFEKLAGESFEARVFRYATEGWNIYEYPGGYARMLADRPIATDYIGAPERFAVSPVNSNYVRFDNYPATGDAGKTLYYLYEKRISFTENNATEELPFSDTVSDALVPVTAEYWKRVFNNDMDPGVFQAGLVRAVNYARKMPPRNRYGKKRGR